MNLSHLFLLLPSRILFTACGVLGVGFLIGIHELGHFLFAKMFRVRTPSFSIGFGPRLISKKIGDTHFSLSAIPLGGYVEVAGMAEVAQGEQKHAYDTDPHSFVVKPFWQKLLILFGGILFNILFAYAAITLTFMLGAPKTKLLYPLGIAKTKPVIHAIRQGSAAEQADLAVNDHILAINNIEVHNDTDKLTNILNEYPNQPVLLTIERDGQHQKVEVILDQTEKLDGQTVKTVGTLGVLFELVEPKKMSFFESVIQGMRATNIYIQMVGHMIKNIFVRKDISGIGGPLMVIYETVKGAEKGFKVFLMFLAVISINLAVLNLIPLPIFDGGQILFVTIEAIIGRQLPIKVREYIHVASWLFVLALMIYLTARDAGIFKFLGIGS